MAWYEVLQAHEFGHLFGLRHTNDPSVQNVMAPNLEITADVFTEASHLYFESGLPGFTCLSTCHCIEISQVTPDNCSGTGTSHDLNITVEHEQSSGSFTVSAGGISQSFSYQTSPQTVILAGVDSGTTNITATDDIDPLCTFSTSFELPGSSSITFETNPPYCASGLPGPQMLSAAPLTSMGSIILEVSGDLQSELQQSAQILDSNGNVVVDWPVTSFGQSTTTILNSGNLELSRAPFRFKIR